MAKIFKHRTDVAYFDYKDFKTLQRYVNVYGQIETRKKTGLTVVVHSANASTNKAFKQDENES